MFGDNFKVCFVQCVGCCILCTVHCVQCIVLSVMCAMCKLYGLLCVMLLTLLTLHPVSVQQHWHSGAISGEQPRAAQGKPGQGSAADRRCSLNYPKVLTALNASILRIDFLLA